MHLCICLNILENLQVVNSYIFFRFWHCHNSLLNVLLIIKEAT